MSLKKDVCPGLLQNEVRSELCEGLERSLTAINFAKNFL